MVGIGTIVGGITLVIGAVVGYAIYSNRGKIQDSTKNIIGGVESSATRIGQKFADASENIIPSIQPTTLKNPFEVMFGNWMSSMSSLGGKTVVYKDNTQVYVPRDNTVTSKGTVVGTPPTMDLGPDARQTAEDAFRKNKAFSKAGYYYFDHPGSKWDTQQYISQDKLSYFKKAIGQPGVGTITYMSPNKLGRAGFTAFGKSKGYL